MPALVALGAAVALLNLAGYAWHWFWTIGFYDELVHGATSLWAALLSWTVYRLKRGAAPSPVPAFGALVGLTLSGGLAWEYCEAATGIIGSRWDTLVDLAMDWIGGAAAGFAAMLDLRLHLLTRPALNAAPIRAAASG